MDEDEDVMMSMKTRMVIQEQGCSSKDEKDDRERSCCIHISTIVMPDECIEKSASVQQKVIQRHL